jgi:hypothetical protein
MIRVFKVELTYNALAEAIDKIVEIYNARLHSTTKRVPAQDIAEEKAAGRVQILSAEDDAQLDMLVGPSGIRIVTKKGISVGNIDFLSDDLIPWIGRSIEYVETPDQGRLAIYTPTDPPEFVCIASNPELTGTDRQVMALATREVQSRRDREQRKEHKRKARQFKAETWRQILENESAAAAVQLQKFDCDAASNVISLPYKIPSLSAAAKARAALAALESEPAKVRAQPAKSEEPVQLTDAEKAERRERRKRLAAIPLAEWTKDERLFALGFDGGRWGDAPLDDDVSWLCGPRLTRANHA